MEPTGSSLENVRASEEEAANAAKDCLVYDIYLAVPELKRDRAASVDSCFSKVSGGRAEELNGTGNSLTVPGSGLRSRSVDIVLPTAEQSRYKALALTSQAQQVTTTSNQQKQEEPVPQTVSPVECRLVVYLQLFSVLNFVLLFGLFYLF